MIWAHANTLTGCNKIWKLRGEVAAGSRVADALPIARAVHCGSAHAHGPKHTGSHLREQTRKWNEMTSKHILRTFTGTQDTCIFCRVSWIPVHKSRKAECVICSKSINLPLIKHNHQYYEQLPGNSRMSACENRQTRSHPFGKRFGAWRQTHTLMRTSTFLLQDSWMD